MSEEKQKKRQLFTGEIVWYSIFAVIWLTGLVFAILGMCAYNIGKLSTNPLYTMQKTLGTFFHISNGVMDCRLVGSIAMIIAMIGILIVIFYYSNKAVQEENKKRLQEERRKILMESEETK